MCVCIGDEEVTSNTYLATKAIYGSNKRYVQLNYFVVFKYIWEVNGLIEKPNFVEEFVCRKSRNNEQIEENGEECNKI